MPDDSDLDKKYFIDIMVYNCPFCNRRNVEYGVKDFYEFNWSNNKTCNIYLVKCYSCRKVSMHLSYRNILDVDRRYLIHGEHVYRFKNIEIDSKIFYSVPTSFFVIDSRINKTLRELITEAEGCIKMNYLTGASACTRKAIYELLVLEKAEGDNYESKIKFLKGKFTESDPSNFEILGQIQQMTSDKIHEQSWDKWDSPTLKLIIETLKNVLYDIYVIPAIKKERSIDIQKLQEVIKKETEGGKNQK